MKRRYKMQIAYDGTPFSGWQRQPHSTSIQELIEKALTILLKEPISITGSGRTDQGVHARGQVAHFDTSTPIEHIPTLLVSLAALLPPQIRIQTLEMVQSTFHARYGAKKKTYHYHIWTNPIQCPFQFPYTYHVYTPLDMDLMAQAAKKLSGTHDFTSYCNQGEGKNNVRTIYRIDFALTSDGFVVQIEGNGFLYKMCRNLVGTLLAVGKGKISLDDVEKILSKRDRKAAPAAVPPHGLTLEQVIY
ncbi:MAG: tRNA pseudouridine synthase A [Chlamydiia bacterium]|nr:tRNA pseudouridine synthase A [Chlamydiia bacterium]